MMDLLNTSEPLQTIPYGTVCQKCRQSREMSKLVLYTIDIAIENDGIIAECQCECAAGMGPLAHCKHICMLAESTHWK